jgi:hypothetical protein
MGKRNVTIDEDKKKNAGLRSFIYTHLPGILETHRRSEAIRNGKQRQKENEVMNTSHRQAARTLRQPSTR